jgi:hypothetical protein
MNDKLMTRAQALASIWRNDAKKRRTISPQDNAADILEYCASELMAEFDALADDELTVAQYAEMHQRAPSTVRRWCQRGLIPCREAGREYRIRRGTPCPNLVAA